MIQAEQSEAKLARPAGNPSTHYSCDNEFFHLAAHVEKGIKDKIRRGEVDIDLSKLLVKRRLSKDTHLEIANKEGRSYFVPTIEKETQEINNYKTWQKAFWVFSGRYTQTNPGRVNQLYQYVGTIASAAETYVWDNVYAYDQIFRQLMTEHPSRSWDVLYTHGWNLLLRDVVPKSSSNLANANNRKNKDKNGKGRRCAGDLTKAGVLLAQLVSSTTDVLSVVIMNILCQYVKRGTMIRTRRTITLINV